MNEIIYFSNILLAIKLINITAKKVHAKQNNFFGFNIKLGVKAKVFPSFPGQDKSVASAKHQQTQIFDGTMHHNKSLQTYSITIDIVRIILVLAVRSGFPCR